MGVHLLESGDDVYCELNIASQQVIRKCVHFLVGELICIMAFMAVPQYQVFTRFSWSRERS